MRIEFVEIQNFRKLKSIRIDLHSEKTLFIGANNSGKTTAMVALRRFLIEQKNFNTHDFIVSSWKKINKIGQNWEKLDATPSDLAEWEDILPTMDVWLQVESNELHYVQHLLPTLDWDGGLLGVRLRLEPEELKTLHEEYITARQRADMIIEAKKSTDGRNYNVPLWPTCMKDFFERDFKNRFCIRSYILDPTKLASPKNDGLAQLQKLPPSAEYIKENPFAGLISIREINAQRGFSDANNISFDGLKESTPQDNKYKLSDQLRVYYTNHLDPSEMPELKDVDALEAIHTAQTLFDERLKISFAKAFEEIGSLGYPGISDPNLTISTRIKPTDGLNHSSALQYDVIYNHEDPKEIPPRLPEQYNGLGYQNLISMVFRLMSFRDKWMRVGKNGKKRTPENEENFFPPPLLLVLVEEPEAHLHVQVQQVFIRRAYEILRNHEDLRGNKALTTQLIVSTHSSHVTHECDFECLRYFRRKQALIPGDVPTSAVINLSEVFGKQQDDTAKFVTRYLRAAHCDLFFADAAIFIEGAAERIMIPHFIREHFPKLNQRYLTLLEIGGSHAHRFKPLIEHLGLSTLIISDIDAAENTKCKSSQPIARGSDQVTRNTTLSSWIPATEKIDKLLDMSNLEKIKDYSDKGFSVRVAYQSPISLILDNSDNQVEIVANTFEDALAYENIDIFKNLDGNGLIRTFKKILNENKTPESLNKSMFFALKAGNKAEFALELLFLKEPKIFQVPSYIREGLEWLQEQICKEEKEIIGTKSENDLSLKSEIA